MPLDTRTLCQYRLERAKEDILTAENNQQAGFYKAAITVHTMLFFTVFGL